MPLMAITENIAAEIVTAILMRFPQSPARNCIMARRQHIESVLVSSANIYPEMPVEIIATVGFLETHLGCARGEGGNWGAPISPLRRHIPGTPLQAARALWRSYEVCGNWEGAARRFRTGLCRPTIVGTRYGRMAVNVARSIRMQVLRNRESDTRVCL
jgi:hypothetical protein